MTLLAPEVKGPVSICSKKVRIKGHIAGSTVSVFVNGAQTSSKASGWPDDVFDVGTALNVGDKITAKQEFGGDTSPESPLPAIVQNVPATLASLTILTDLHSCGSAIWSEGAVPGADVRVIINGNQAGAATSIDGIARMKYSPVLDMNQTLSLQQTTCTGLTNVTVSKPAKPLPNALPIPAIAQPLIECMTAIKISKVIDGATVTIYRNGVKEAGGAFDRPSLTWIGLKPLKEGDLIEVDQSFTCRRRGSPDAGGGDPPPTHISGKGNAMVQSAANLPKPVILAPVCPNPILITISNLLPSARVILYSDGVEVGMSDTPESTFSFSAPALGPNATLTARMQLCGKDGPLSSTVKVQSDKPLNELQVSKLYECASYIFILHWTALASGKIVYAMNKSGDIISAYHQVFTPMFLFPVSPALTAGDEIRIVVLGCSGAKEEFGPFLVAPLEQLSEPTLKEPIPEASTGVSVLSGVAGAIIEVFVDGAYRAQAVSFGDALHTQVTLGQPPLQFGQIVTARQSFCGVVSKFSKTVTVVIPYPQSPQLIYPAKFATGIPAQPTTFKWKDPGANTSAAATSFKLRVYSGFTLVFEASGSSNQADAVLNYSSEYMWNVAAFNSTGDSLSTAFTFETAPPPAPEEEPPAENAALALVSWPFASYDGITQVWPLPGNTAFYLCVIVANLGNATSDPFDIVFSWDGNGLNGTTTVNAPAAAPGWSDLKYATFASGLPEGYYNFHATLVVNGTALQTTSWIQAWVGF
jgi:hypothetical protein